MENTKLNENQVACEDYHYWWSLKVVWELEVLKIS